MSDFIEIDKKLVIFDDPEYCCDVLESKTYRECRFIFFDSTYCVLYGNENEIELKTGLVQKCDECKTAWETAKKNYLKPCEKCKKPRGEDERGAYICPCPHCGDEIPF